MWHIAMPGAGAIHSINGACLLTSIITLFGTAASETDPSMIRAKTPISATASNGCRASSAGHTPKARHITTSHCDL
jgi:hypothetical protein